MASGAITGFVISFIEGPIDLIKTKMQIQIFSNGSPTSTTSRTTSVTSTPSSSAKPPFTSLVSCIQYTVKTNGLRSLFQGLGATMVRNIPANALFIPTNEFVKTKCAAVEGVKVEDISMFSRFISGACGGLGYWVTTYPLDVVKATSQSFVYGERRTWLETAEYVYQHGGGSRQIKNFFRGFWPCAIRAIPACAAMFTTVDIVRDALTGGAIIN